MAFTQILEVENMHNRRHPKQSNRLLMKHRFVAAIIAAVVIAGCSQQSEPPEQEAFPPDIDNLAACAPNLSMDEVIALLRDTRGAAGQAVPQTEWVTGAAIAKAESGLCSDATNDNTNGSTDYGLFQINSIHPYDDADPARLFDPSYNTVAAVEIYTDSGSWQPWSTFNADKHEQFLGEAQAAYDRVVGGGGTPPPACEMAWGTVQGGDQGSAVTALQHLLNHHAAGIGVDGQFGPLTEGAVKTFQRSRGLVDDGVVGPQTWGALTGSLVLSEGSRGEAVKAVQAVVGTSQDGAFGPLTRDAVETFQRSKRINADGVVGPQTWTVLLGGTATCDGGGGPAPGGADGLAQGLLDQAAAGELDVKAGPKANLESAAAGQPAQGGDGTAVVLAEKMLQEVVNLSAEFGTLRISSIADGGHSAGSYHYQGRAVDISAIDGRSVIERGLDADVQRLISLCDTSGAVESIGPGEPDHDDHVHCAW